MIITDDVDARWNWLRVMYFYTIIGAGGVGIGIIFTPDLVRVLSGLPIEDPVIFGVLGSTYFSFGLLSVLGLRSPLKFIPVLLLQLTYKIVWFLSVFFPLLITGKLPNYAILIATIFATYIFGDLIAIPFRYFWVKDTVGSGRARTKGDQ